MKFDIVIGNPPYQDSKNKRSPLWQKFVKLSFNLVKDSGFLSLIHPGNWRKPEHELFGLFKKNNIKYLEIHNQSDGLKIFGAGTRYDWYVVQKSHPDGNTVVKDEIGNIYDIDMGQWEFLPNYNYEEFKKLLALGDEPRCEVLYSRSAYGSDKSCMSKVRDTIFKYPCVHATKSSGPEYWYSNNNSNGFFGIKKVIMGLGSPNKGFYDDGKFGITQNAFGIKVDDDNDGKNFVKFLKTQKFKELQSLLSWSGFAIDFRAFGCFKKDFWKDFI